MRLRTHETYRLKSKQRGQQEASCWGGAPSVRTSLKSSLGGSSFQRCSCSQQGRRFTSLFLIGTVGGFWLSQQ